MKILLTYWPFNYARISSRCSVYLLEIVIEATTATVSVCKLKISKLISKNNLQKMSLDDVILWQTIIRTTIIRVEEWSLRLDTKTQLWKYLSVFLDMIGFIEEMGWTLKVSFTKVMQLYVAIADEKRESFVDFPRIRIYYFVWSECSHIACLYHCSYGIISNDI